MDTFLQDLRQGFRALLKNPGLTAVGVLTLALGIGANTAIFTVIDATLLRPLPYRSADRVVMVFETEPELTTAPVTPPDYFDWKEQNDVFESMAAGTEDSANLTGAGEPERLELASVSANFFEMLGTQPMLGRPFRVEEDQPGKNLVVILSHALWRRKFGADPAVIGRKVTLDGYPCEVVGVLPAEFQFPPIWGNRPAFFMPLGLARDETLRGSHILWVMAHLRSGVTVEKARSGMEAIAARLATQYPSSNAHIGVNLKTLREQFTGDVRRPLLILFGVVGFVLLIACTNMANLSLARATAREREIAIRAALGARRGRVIRQLLTESIILSLFGGLAGILLAVWAKDALLALGPADFITRAGRMNLNPGVLAFTLTLSLLTGVAFGLVPALQASRIRFNETLKEGGSRLSSGTRGRRFRSALIVAEVSLTLVLLIGAGLMVRSLHALLKVDPGFDPKNILTMKTELPDLRYPKEDQQVNFYQKLLEKIRPLPGVQSVAATSQLPLGGGPNGWILIEGRPRDPVFSGPLVQPTSVTLDYLKAMGIRLLKGRSFASADSPNAPHVAIINEKLARQFWPNENPLGKRLSWSSDSPVWCEVVGIVQDVREWGLANEPIAEAYFPQSQKPSKAMNLVIRSEGDPTALTLAARARISELDKDLAIFGVSTMDQIIASSVSFPRFQSVLMSLFGLLALLLSAVGVYGVIAYSVSLRTQEMGIRMALGATREDLLKHLLRQGLVLTLIGVTVGLAGALALTRFMSSLLYGVRPNDTLTFVVGSLGLVCVIAAAIYIPSRRATKVDPVVALRYE
ncbi:MAG: ABC transporter permease [Acidobacteriia bacterium]|nr:ABC transporter permease [Terriglobia bacterium]